MRKTAALFLTLALAMSIAPLRLPAAACILSNAPSHQACQPDCCANKTCCAVSKKNTGPVSQTQTQSAAAKQQVIGLVPAAPAIDSNILSFAARPVRTNSPIRAHSPPPLAATCIRLI
jgi:hypothetical protein